MVFESAEAIALAWQEAANNQDVERLLGLSAPQIEIVGPRGSGHGHQLLREWIARAGIRLTTQRVFAHSDSVVVAQKATWHDATTGAAVGEAEVASRFRVADCRVALVARHDDLAAALAEAGLAEANMVQAG